MELIEGETLAVRLFEGPIPPAEVVRIAKQVADALCVAHDRGAFSVHLLRAMTALELDGRARFALPETLTQAWHLAPADSEESFWRKLAERA